MIRRESPPKAAATAPGKAQCWRVACLCLVLAAITFAVFGQTAGFGFVNFDDNKYVYENPVVAQGLTLRGIVWAFTHFHSANWHPLTWLSHMLDCQLYGLNPGGHHLTNVLLHTATVIALFLVLRQMTGALWRSAFVAAVFAIHPLRVESVAWVAERKDVESGLIFVLTIWAYVRYARRAWSWGRYGLVVLLFAMGLMTKPMLVTLPVVLLLLDYWPLQRVGTVKFYGLVLEKLPLLALSAAAGVVTLVAQTGAIQSNVTFSLPLRLCNALVTCMVYLGQMVWPAGLAVWYPYPYNGLPPWEVILAGMLLAGLSVAAFWQRRKQPWLLVGWLWYLVMLLPVAGIIQAGGQAHADRYTYLPQIGIYVALTWMAAEWGATWRTPRAVYASLMAGALAVLMVCSWKQTAYWRNSETLWLHAIACTTDNEMAHYNLGVALDKKGRVDEAINQYQEALQILPTYGEAHNNLGMALAESGRVDEAMPHFQRAIQLRPDYVEPRINLGNGFLQKGRVDEACAQYEKAAAIQPDNAGTHYSLGTALLQRGRVDEAIAQYEKALAIKPDYAKAHNNLGSALLQKGKVKEAILHYEQALQIEPANLDAQNNLAWLLATAPETSLRNGEKAVELARQANATTGGKSPVILGTLAAALAEAGRFSEAVETAQGALRAAEAQSNTGLARQLQFELTLYQAGSPFHIPEPSH